MLYLIMSKRITGNIIPKIKVFFKSDRTFSFRPISGKVEYLVGECEREPFRNELWLELIVNIVFIMESLTSDQIFLV